MTEIQFFNQLKKLNLVLVRYYKDTDPIIRADNKLCPVVAVAKQKGIEVLDHSTANYKYKNYAKKLELDPQLAKEIALAADFDNNQTIRLRRCNKTRVLKLRQKLTKLCSKTLNYYTKD